MKKGSNFVFGITISVLLCCCFSSADEIRTGMIKGAIVDAETKTPLMGANVVVLGTKRGAASDDIGHFIILDVPVGSYTLQFSYLGYETMRKTDIIVRSERITFVQSGLKPSVIEGQAITVTAGYFSQTEEQPTSAVHFSYEEIRRAPGSAGDVSRILMILPSVAKVNDQSNGLIVRGGSPVENAFFIDNIEIPNINHFPTQGSTGGPIGLVNVDFIRDVHFSTGGFSSMYGDKLSSVMDITFREGNPDEFDGQLDLNFAGFGGVAEGPLFDNKGSWLFSVRRSYLDLLVKAFDVGTSIAPSYGDYQGKVVFDVASNHKLMLLGVFGDDHNSPDKDAAEEYDMIVYGDQDLYVGTTGINWQAVWPDLGYSNTSISYSSQKFEENFIETTTDSLLMVNNSHEQTVRFRNVNHLRLALRHSMECGLEIKHLVTDFENYYNEYTDALGDMVPEFTLNVGESAEKYGAFLSYRVKPISPLTVEAGLRADHFCYNDNTYISPRFSIAVQLTRRTSINGSAGLFYQSLPAILLFQDEENRDLKDPRAVHYVLGLGHLLTENTKFTLEVYRKDYDFFPIDPTQPSLFLIDELYYRYGFFFNHGRLTDTGKARSNGIEMMIQKKLAENFYGLASASYFRSEYRDDRGTWVERVFDNRYIMSVEGGYKPNNKWEFSLRWIFAGGPPYTPLDVEASKAINRAVLDDRRINDARYPDYHSLNLRFDRRLHFTGSNLVFYLSVWNAYNRKNVASYFWNEMEQKQDIVYQWSLLPIMGFEYEF
jgi:hypothetical protein